MDGQITQLITLSLAAQACPWGNMRGQVIHIKKLVIICLSSHIFTQDDTFSECIISMGKGYILSFSASQLHYIKIRSAPLHQLPTDTGVSRVSALISPVLRLRQKKRQVSFGQKKKRDSTGTGAVAFLPIVQKLRL